LTNETSRRPSITATTSRTASKTWKVGSLQAGFNLKQLACILEENKQLKLQLERLKDNYMELSKEFGKARQGTTFGR
jgi:hypothetical protein